MQHNCGVCKWIWIHLPKEFTMMDNINNIKWIMQQFDSIKKNLALNSIGS
jgi:hypothetical protein